MSTEHESCADAAVRWAMGMIGSGDYRYRCVTFVREAYEIANHIELPRHHTAREAAEAYGTEAGSVPPRGALVFYDYWGTLEGEHRNWGHVGLSTGDGRVIHAWGSVQVHGYLEVEELDAGEEWTKPRYIGWTPVSRVLEGMTPRGSGCP